MPKFSKPSTKLSSRAPKKFSKPLSNTNKKSPKPSSKSNSTKSPTPAARRDDAPAYQSQKLSIITSNILKIQPPACPRTVDEDGEVSRASPDKHHVQWQADRCNGCQQLTRVVCKRCKIHFCSACSYQEVS